MYKKLVALLISVITVLSCISCEKGGNPSSQQGNGEIDFWSTYATEKVLQDLTYTGDKFVPELNVFAARGEYESGQIIMTAISDVANYDVKISSLKNANGVEFSTDNIIVYNQKYIEVTQNYENTSAPLGMYPDAILPFEAAKNYGENKIKAGENQGLYFTFNVPYNQAVGTYTGNFTVSYDGKSKTIPVSLEIIDLTVSEVNRSKNIFLSQWNYEAGELHGSQEMYDAYTDKLVEYRLAPQYVVTDNMHSDEDIAYYTEKAYEYMQNPRFTNLSIPYKTNYSTNPELWEGEQLSIDKEVFAKYLRAFAMKSYETGYNMFEKANVYFNIIDEPDSQGLIERTKAVYYDYKETIEKVANELEADAVLRPANKEEVIAGIRNLPEVIPCYYSDEYAPYVQTLVPGVQDLLNQYDKYKAHQDELWWYTCIGPRAPQPTYHTEDTLVSAREMSWMQAEYDVVGNLYWAVNRYAIGANNDVVEDYYATACRYPQVNGDGYLFYPGGQYGLDEPVGSLRLEAIRDGLEEYEIALDCEDKYNALSEKLGIALDWKGCFNKITKSIYNGTTVTSESAEFYNARKNFYSLAQMTLGNSDFAMVDFADDGYGNLTYRFYVANGYTLSCNGNSTDIVENVKDGKIYTIKLNQNAARSAMFEVNGEKVLSFTEELGGAVTLLQSDSFANSFKAGTASVTTAVENRTEGDGLGAGLRGMFLNLKVGAVANGEEQNIRFEHDFISNIGTDTDSVVMYIYNNGDKVIDFTIAAKFVKNGNLISNLATAKLQPKTMTAIKLENLYNIQWNKYQAIDYLLFYYENSTGEANNSLYLFDTIVYGR